MQRIGILWLSLIMLISLPLMGASSAMAATDMQPDAIVQSIADDLADKIEAHRDELKGNKNAIADLVDEVLLPYFDVNYSAILVLGRHAREATPEQRSRFAKAFYRSIMRYGEALLDYTRGAVKVLPLRGDINPKRTTVRTNVGLDSDKSASVNYVFRQTQEGDWKVYDVVIEGISYISNYRNQVDGEIKKDGLDTFIQKLESNGEEVLKDVEE